VADQDRALFLLCPEIPPVQGKSIRGLEINIPGFSFLYFVIYDHLLSGIEKEIRATGSKQEDYKNKRL